MNKKFVFIVLLFISNNIKSLENSYDLPNEEIQLFSWFLHGAIKSKNLSFLGPLIKQLIYTINELSMQEFNPYNRNKKQIKKDLEEARKKYTILLKIIGSKPINNI